MQANKHLQDRIMRSEDPISKHINIIGHYDHDTLLDKSAKLIKIIKIAGIDFSTIDEATLDIYKTRRNNLLKSFSSEFGFYFWEVRRKVNPILNGEMNGIAKDLHKKYQNKLFTSEMFRTEHYLGVITKQPEGLMQKSFSLINRFNYALDKTAKENYLKKRHTELNQAVKKIVDVLGDYECEILSVKKVNNFEKSISLTFVSQSINFDSSNLPLQSVNAARALSHKRIFFNRKSGIIELRTADGSSKFCAMLSIKAYASHTYQGMFEELAKLPCEYTITQSFRPYDRQVSKSRLREQQNEMLQTKDESISQAEQIDQAFDEAAGGEVGYGKHHFTLCCFANSQEELNKNISTIVSIFSNLDIVCVREDVACELAFWAQLPGNFAYICRAADISTRNMAGLASLHNYPLGKAKDNHWGDAVTIFETESGSPYYFNFHYRDVGNFLVFGAMGSGKTVLIGFLIAQSMKFGGKRIIFDKDRGLEIFVKAMRGNYERIKPGTPTGFNPCQLENSSENRKFLAQLFKAMLQVSSKSLTERDIEVIENAISGMYNLDQSSRQLCHIASFFGAKQPGSLRARFDQWHSDGAHAWAFDNKYDALNLNADILGFDLGAILNDPDCKTTVLMYLTYRIEKAIEGQRGIIFFDEGWLALQDAYFQSLINDFSRTPRKKNNIFGLATQVANDTVASNISKSINESAFCKIFFPNPMADAEVYIEDLGLSPKEYELIKTLPDNQHYFLLVHGRGENKESVVLRANLSGLEDEIAVISARESTLALFDQIRAEVGDDPDDWVPLFHARRKGAKV